MKNRTLILILALILIFLPLLEFWLNIFGPLNSQPREAVFLIPIYSTALEPEKKNELNDYLIHTLKSSHKYLHLDYQLVKSKFADKNIDLDKLIKYPNPKVYKQIGNIASGDKILRGYVSKSNKGWEFFARLHDINFDMDYEAVKIHFSDLENYQQKLKQFADELLNRRKGFSLSDLSYVPLLWLHMLMGLIYLGFFVSNKFFHLNNRARKFYLFCVYRLPEILFIVCFVVFLFAIIFSANANLDYVKKFIATGGNIALSQDSTMEMAKAFGRYLPLLLCTGFIFAYFRIKFKRTSFAYHQSMSFFRIWGMPMVLIAALAVSLSYPSFLSLDGFGFLAFFALVPLFFVFDQNRYLWAVFYGIIFGIVSTIITNFWLGTYNLFALQFLIIVFTINYILLMFPMLGCYKLLKKFRLGFVVFPLAWIVFDFFRSTGFLAIPWGFIGTSQYLFLPFIQSASILGIWGVSFFVILINAVLFLVLRYRNLKSLAKIRLSLVLSLSLVVLNLLFGTASLLFRSEKPDKVVRMALIQENMDPRKDKSEKVLSTLLRLTEESVKKNPDIIIWSEGALEWYVRSELNNNPEYSKGAEMIQKFMEYQKKTGIWLLTGTYDTNFVDGPIINEKQKKHNSTMLFSPKGDITGIYHKVHLVPFSEYFPYEKELPWMMELLDDYDEHFWDPGEHRVIFNHPDFSFFTPICFEDVFPSEVRLSVLKGADVIVNVSNDFWSMTPVEAKQHSVNSFFRAVENNRPIVRSTVCGLTCYVTETGLIVDQIPYFQEDYLIVDVPIKNNTTKSIYTLWGDWFPYLCLFILAGLTLFGGVRLYLNKRKKSKSSS